MFTFNHINLIVESPKEAAAFYQRHLMPGGEIVQLGDSFHLRDRHGSDLAFRSGKSVPSVGGAHHGFLAGSAEQIDGLLAALKAEGVSVTDDCLEEGFRSIKFLDPFGYECEVYWEADWPQA